MSEPKNNSDEYWVCYSGQNINFFRDSTCNSQDSDCDVYELPSDALSALHEMQCFLEYRGYKKFRVLTRNFDVFIMGCGTETSSEATYSKLDFEEEKAFWASKLKQMHDKNTTLPPSQEDLSRAVAALTASQKYLFEALIKRSALNSRLSPLKVSQNNSSFRLLTSQLTKREGEIGKMQATIEWMQDQINNNSFEETIQELAVAYDAVLGLVLLDFHNAMSIQHSISNAAAHAKQGKGYLSLELTKQLDHYLLEGFSNEQIKKLFSEYYTTTNVEGRLVKIKVSTVHDWIIGRQKVRKFTRSKLKGEEKEHRDARFNIELNRLESANQ